MTFCETAYRRERYAKTKALGLCVNCGHTPALIKRTRCQRCSMVQVIKEAFKYDKKRTAKGSTQARGSCYVQYFRPDIRALWVEEVISKWTGRCFYTGLEIEVGATAGLDHTIPVSRADVFGPSRVYHPDNLVWCHKSINILKGDKTADEFAWWLRHELPAAIETVAA